MRRDSTIRSACYGIIVFLTFRNDYVLGNTGQEDGGCLDLEAQCFPTNVTVYIPSTKSAEIVSLLYGSCIEDDDGVFISTVGNNLGCTISNTTGE